MESLFAFATGLVGSCVYEDVGSAAAFNTLRAVINISFSLCEFSKICKPSIALKSTKIFES